MAAHHKNEEQDLGAAEKLASYTSSQYFSCVRHIVDVWISELELANYEASVGCEDAESQDKNDAASGKRNQCGSSVVLLLGLGLTERDRF